MLYSEISELMDVLADLPVDVLEAGYLENGQMGLELPHSMLPK